VGFSPRLSWSSPRKTILPAANFFTPELFVFLKQLKRNNDRDWFAKNKSRYEECVVNPALAFITEFASHLYDISPHFVADARPTRGSLFRIYRDTRFSSDKRPYKTHIGIRFMHSKGKDIHAPIFYLHLEPGGCFAAAGVWHPDNPLLTKIRTAIVNRPEEWEKVRSKLSLEGGKLKNPPRGFDPEHPFVEDLKMKDFVASVVLSEADICGSRFVREYVAACKKMAPLVAFTTQALGLKY
jgi:uncharacterized protein (TIGR02453 family)